MGIPDVSSLSRLREAVQITKALTQGREIAIEGKFFSVQRTKLQSSKKYDIPIYVPAIRDNAIKFASEYADGIFLSNCSSVKFVEYVTKLLSQYHKNDNFGIAALSPTFQRKTISKVFGLQRWRS